MRSLNINRKDRSGMKQGLWEFNYYENGNIARKGSYKDDLAEGEWRYYFENGQLYSKGSYVNGNKDGIWEYYNKDGSLDCKILYGIMVI
jgi:antitoxin component YwqK of YwqJK toxin-antitoxin module